MLQKNSEKAKHWVIRLYMYRHSVCIINDWVWKENSSSIWWQ